MEHSIIYSYFLSLASDNLGLTLQMLQSRERLPALMQRPLYRAVDQSLYISKHSFQCRCCNSHVNKAITSNKMCEQLKTVIAYENISSFAYILGCTFIFRIIFV